MWHDGILWHPGTPMDLRFLLSVANDQHEMVCGHAGRVIRHEKMQSGCFTCTRELGGGTCKVSGCPKRRGLMPNQFVVGTKLAYCAALQSISRWPEPGVWMIWMRFECNDA